VLSSPTFGRALRFGVAALTLVLLSGLGAKVASAASGSCADQVIADWYDDGRVGKIYPLACYQQAIKKLPPDVLDYSNAKEEIGRALAFAKQGKPDPGGQDPTPPVTTTSSTTTETTSTPTTSTDTNTTSTSTTAKTTPETTNVFTPGTTSTTDTSGPSSVPMPLLVLGGLAILLLAAGSAGYLRRRMSGDGTDDGSPPAGA
jgi:cobalamin biosynthesis Mg chelatase CobN